MFLASEKASVKMSVKKFDGVSITACGTCYFSGELLLKFSLVSTSKTSSH